MRESTAFIAAMRQEVGPFLRRLGDWRRGSLGTLPLYRFSLFGHECLLIESGVGMRRAESACRALLSAHRPERLVSFGVSGGTTAEIQVGDVIAIRSVSLYGSYGVGNALPVASWSGEALGAAAAALAACRGAHKGMLHRGGTRTAGAREPKLVSGALVTTHGEQAVALPANELENSVLDMESWAIARVAADHALPLLSMRAVSDSPAQPLPFRIAELLDSEERLRIGRVIAAAIGRPRLILELGRLGGAMAIAMEHLTAALLAALELQPQEPGSQGAESQPQG
ncbi:MAG TPA: hypothetical protein VMV68_02685 [Spirochaetia bacterium]|nr:hypothetical protein [Spirochaetia bacterium]